MDFGDRRLARCLDVAGRFRLVVPAGESSSVGTANPVDPDGSVVAGSPIVPCETLSALSHDALGPLEHSFPDETILGLDPLEHSGLDHAEILSRVEELLSSLDVAGRFFRPVVPAGESSSVGTAKPVDPDGPVVTGSPMGPCETLSPLFHDVLGPLEHSVLDETIHTSLDPLGHSGLDHADPAGQHAAVGPVGLFGTLSPSGCCPAGPAGPYVAGGPVGPDDKFQVLDPLEHSGADHADPAGQHAIFQDVIDSGAVRAFGSRHSPGWSTYGGIPVSEPLEHSVLGGGGAWTADSWRGCHI